MEVNKLKVIKLSSSDVIIKLLHHVPGSVSNPHQDDGEWQLAGLHYGGHRGGLILHLTVSDDDEDVEDVVALHHVSHGSPDDGREACWSTEDDSPHCLVIFLQQIFKVPASSPLPLPRLQGDVEDTPVLGLSVPEPVAVDGVEVSEGLESFPDDIYDFLIGIVDGTRPGVYTVLQSVPPSPSDLTGCSL